MPLRSDTPREAVKLTLLYALEKAKLQHDSEDLMFGLICERAHSQGTAATSRAPDLTFFQVNELTSARHAGELASAKNLKLTNLHFQLTKFTQNLSRVKEVNLDIENPKRIRIFQGTP